MNIFYLDEDLKKNAQYHADRHCIKMILELCQVASSTHYMLDSGYKPQYKLTHKNHPCSVWARQQLGNYLWLIDHALALCEEYTFRYGRTHKTEAVLRSLQENVPKFPNMNSNPDLNSLPEVMPEEFKTGDVIKSYREYYRVGKSHLHVWTKRDIPEWITYPSLSNY